LRVSDTAATTDGVRRLPANIETVFLGKSDVVRQCCVGLLAGGHLLIEDVPGVGKTVLARALAKSLDLSFARIQFTPDLLPSDILGVSIYEQKTGAFDFKKGPIFSNVVLADEINRTTPRTQSSLLEAMNEGQVSIDGRTYDLPRPFLVIATQNPFEFEGTYPLPENQLDRFILRVRIGYPTREHERDILRAHRNSHPAVDIGPVMTGPQVLDLQDRVAKVRVDPSIYDYILALAEATRADNRLRVGASVRGSLALLRVAQASALLDGRDYVVPDDVKDLAVGVLGHRVLARGWSPEGRTDPGEDVVRDILRTVPCPS